MGKAYLLISNLYADSANGCGDSQFNKRAVFWLAAQTARKAGRVDASLKKLSDFDWSALYQNLMVRQNILHVFSLHFTIFGLNWTDSINIRYPVANHFDRLCLRFCFRKTFKIQETSPYNKSRLKMIRKLNWQTKKSP